MSTSTRHPLVDDYLRRLDRAARSLPRRQREELVGEIRSHLDAGLEPDTTEAGVRNLLDDLGAPAAIVAAAQPDRPRVQRGAREVFALILLVSGLPPVLGWLIGVGLLLWSPLWSARQKLLGVLVWPGGYLVALGVTFALPLGSARLCPTPVGSGEAAKCTTSAASAWPFVAVGFLLLAPIVVAVYLYRAAGRRAEAA